MNQQIEPQPPFEVAPTTSAAQPSVTLIVSLVLATALGPLAMSSFIPAIPSIQAGFAVSTSVAQLTLTVSLISMAVSALLYGSLSDRYGRRPVLLAGVALAIAGSVICAAAPSVYMVIAGRALQSAGATAGLVLARVIVRDVYGDDRASSLIGYITAAMALAPLVGPVAGGYLIDAFGWRSVFLAVAVLAGLLLALLAARLPETARVSRGGPRRLVPAGDYAALLIRPAYLRYALFGAMMHGTFMTFIAGAPYVAMDHFGLSASAYGWNFMVVPVGFLLGSLIAGRFASRWNRERLLVLCGVQSLALCAWAFWLSLQPDFAPWEFFVPMSLLSCVIGAVLPSAQVGLLVSAGPQSGTASGLFSFIQLLLGAGLAQLVGMLITLGPVTVTTGMLGVSAAGLLAALLRPRTKSLAGRPSGADL